MSIESSSGELMELTRTELERAAVQIVGHVLNLHGFWRAYRKLFRGNEESAPILRAAASEFFWLLERATKAAVLQSFRQLTDGPKSMGKDNASLHGLLLAAAGRDYRTEHADMVALIENIAAKPTIRDHVNRYIAHLDLDLLAGRAPAPASIAIDEVEDALSATRQFMDTFMERFLDEAPFAYEEKARVIPDQLDRLIEIIKAGLDVKGRDA